MPVKNRTIFTCDNLEVMRGIADESVDLIYLDPPFNSNHDYAAPIGSQAAGAGFKDTWTLSDIKTAWYGEIAAERPGLSDLLTAIRQVHGKSMMAYLIYMAVRILEMRRILKSTGSLYLHCDPTASHYLKLVMDEIFGKDSFRNEIIWSYRTGGASKKAFAKKHDVVLFYAKTSTYVFNPLTEKAYTKSKGRRPGRINYGGGMAIFDEDEIGVYRVVSMRDVWEVSYLNSQARERTGYPTQKPVKLLERIIQASSNPDDMVLDPFCGCATTCVAAEKLGRRWIGIDISERAAELVKKRIRNELSFLLFKPIHRRDIPQDRVGTRSKNIKHGSAGREV